MTNAFPPRLSLAMTIGACAAAVVDMIGLLAVRLCAPRQALFGRGHETEVELQRRDRVSDLAAPLHQQREQGSTHIMGRQQQSPRMGASIAAEGWAASGRVGFSPDMAVLRKESVRTTNPVRGALAFGD